MNKLEMMRKIGSVLDESKTGILTTIDAEGKPHARWMTPVLLDQWPDAVFAVTSPEFPKIAQLNKNPQVEWMIQTRSLDQIINVRGGSTCLTIPL